MILVFFPVDNEKEYGRYTFKDETDKPETLTKLLELEESRVYDTMVNSDMLQFQCDYNDELIDGGWWSVALDLDEKQVRKAWKDFSEKQE